MIRNVLHEMYTQCPTCHMETLNEELQRHRERYHSDAEDASEPSTCRHGRVVSPAICRRHHGDEEVRNGN